MSFARLVLSSVASTLLLLTGYIYFIQEQLVFPGLSLPKSHGVYKLLPGVTTLRFSTSDGETLQGFTTINPDAPTEYIGLIMHGNGESAETQNFLPFFRNVGIQSLTFDYRGYGDSTGRPKSENDIYLDAEAAAEAAQRLSGRPFSKFVILGNSLGSGPAAYLASKLNPRALVLIAGYANLKQVAKTKPIYGWFAFALKYRFPVEEYVQKLTDQCVVVAHGQNDEVIPFSQAERVVASLPSSTRVTKLASDIATHNDIFYKVEDQLVAATRRCIGAGS